MKPTAGAQNAMELLEHPYGLPHMLDDVLHHDLIEARILERVRELVEVVDDVRLRIRGDVDANRARDLRRAAADVQDPSRPGSEIELVRI
jgi:hypothetical protein